MWKIFLRLPQQELTGYEALAERRRLGLPDGTKLSGHYIEDAEAQSDEEFVRAFGRPNQNLDVQATIPSWDVLMPGDVVPHLSDRTGAVWAPLSRERAERLFISTWALCPMCDSGEREPNPLPKQGEHEC